MSAALLVMRATAWPLVPRSGTPGVPKEGGIVPTPLTVVLLCVLSGGSAWVVAEAAQQAGMLGNR